MKKILLVIAFSSAFTKLIFSQGGNLGNARVPGAVLGWTSGTAGSLEVRNDLTNQPINFFTDGSQRMTIMGGGGTNPGYVGINIANPTAYLHISDGLFANYFQMTNASTGTTGADGFAMQLLFNHVILTHRANGDMYLNTGTGLSNATRMTIVGTTGANLGFVGIGAAFVNPNNMVDVDQRLNMNKQIRVVS